MASTDDITPAEPDLGELAPTSGRIRRALRASRGLVRLVHRDPEHVAERLTLYSVARLGDPSRDWAQAVKETRPDTPAAVRVPGRRAGSQHPRGSAPRGDRPHDLRASVRRSR